MDRRALIIGSWLAQGRNQPTPQKVKSITQRWQRIVEDNEYGFKPVLNSQNEPTLVVHNPDITKILSILGDTEEITSDTEFLIYFIGHSTSLHTDDLELILSVDKNGKDKTCRLSFLLEGIRNIAQIQKLVLILDTCHAGRIRNTLRTTDLDYYALLGTGSAYAFDAHFSEGILRALEEPLRKNDQRIDRMAGGITYKKVFESARNHVLSRAKEHSYIQKPNSDGDYTGDLLLEAPIAVPTAFNPFASRRSIYGRIFLLLNFIPKEGDSYVTLTQILDYVEITDEFILEVEAVTGSPIKSVSKERIIQYLEFLEAIGWVDCATRLYSRTARGMRASNDQYYNSTILDDIENILFPPELNFNTLDVLISGLLTDLIPPTPIRIKERAGMNGIVLRLTSPLRIALLVLPTTGRFLKGSAEAVFPSELGG